MKLEQEMLKEQAKQTGQFIDLDRDKTIYDIYTKGKSSFAGNFFGARQSNGFKKTALKNRENSLDDRTKTFFPSSGQKAKQSPYQLEKTKINFSKMKPESPYQEFRKIQKPMANKGSLSIFDEPVIIQSGPVNMSSFVEVDSRNELPTASHLDSLESIPKKGKTAVSS